MTSAVISHFRNPTERVEAISGKHRTMSVIARSAQRDDAISLGWVRLITASRDEADLHVQILHELGALLDELVA